MLVAIALIGCGRIAFDPLGDDDGDGGGAISLELPPGGQFSQVAIAPDGTWYALSTTTGVFRSDDRATWTRCGALIPTAIAVDIDNSVFASGATIWRSTDRCASWTNTNSPRYTQSVAHAGSQLWGLADNGLLRWTGSGWQTIATALDGNRFLSIAANTAAHVVGTTAGIQFSPDMVNWTAGAGGLATDQIAEVVAGPTRTYAITTTGTGGIACGGANGAAWSACAVPGGYGLFVDPNSDGRVIAAVYDDLIVTTNGFASLSRDQRLATGLDNATVLDIVADSDGTIVLANNRGIYASAPGGTLAFQPRMTGLAAWDIDAMLPANDGVYLATRGGVLRSNAGAPFTISTVGITGNTHIRALVRLPDGRILAAGRNLVVTGDDGQTWSILWPLDIADGYFASSLAFVGSRLYAGTNARLLYAEPPYSSWSASVIIGVSRNVTALAVAGGRLYVGTADGLFSTIDGLGFAQLDIRAVRSLRVLPDGELAIGLANGVVISSGARTIWPAATLTGHDVAGLLDVGATLVAMTDKSVQYTSDRGATWQPVPGLANTAASAALRDGATLVVGTNSGLTRVPLP